MTFQWTNEIWINLWTLLARVAGELSARGASGQRSEAARYLITSARGLRQL